MKIKLPSLYVDADACPVKEEIVEITQKFSIEVIFVASHAHLTPKFSDHKWKYVDSSKEAVDLYIMNHVESGDIVVTQDIGLASTLLLKDVFVISPRGNIFREDEIDFALHIRFLAAKARRQGKYGKGPKRLTQEDKERFKKELVKILSKKEGI